MPSRRPGLIRRFFGGIWAVLDFSRRFILTVIFLGVVVALLVAALASRPVLQPGTALVLDPEGEVVEQHSADPVARALAAMGDGPSQIQLRDLLRAIDSAASDDRIERIVLVPDKLMVGLATVRELGAALERFRATGKEVVALGGNLGQNQYLLAAHADRILLDPEGMVLLEGLASYRSYYREALEKLGIDVHLIKVGAYKSAAEPYILDAASPEAREAAAYWMGGIWDGYLADVGRLRGLEPTALAADIEHFDARIAAHDGDLAALALDQELVDALATRGEARAELREKGVPEGSDGFRQVGWRKYLAGLSPQKLMPRTSQVAVVVAEGEIVSGEQPPGRIGGESTAHLVRTAREDEAVKAIVLRVNSPGGDAQASELIRRELQLAREAGKPVVVSMGDVAASGGYWISMSSDRIFAEPSTITGSIGIFGLLFTVPEGLARLGIHTDGTGTTPLAGAFDIRRPLSPQVESILQSVIQRGYRQFIHKVADARGKTPEQVDAVAQGRVWSGAQALDRGLVDELGGLEQAIAHAASRAGLDGDFGVRYVEREPNAFERALLSMGSNEAMARWLRAGMPALATMGLGRAELRELSGIVDALQGRRWGAFAHCLCGLD